MMSGGRTLAEEDFDLPCVDDRSVPDGFKVLARPDRVRASTPGRVKRSIKSAHHAWDIWAAMPLDRSYAYTWTVAISTHLTVYTISTCFATTNNTDIGPPRAEKQDRWQRASTSKRLARPSTRSTTASVRTLRTDVCGQRPFPAQTAAISPFVAVVVLAV